MSDEKSPEMRRAMSRRGLLTGELRKASVQAAKQIPSMGGFLGAVMRETAVQKDHRLVRNLWLLLMGREPKQHERDASLELMRNAKTADEKGDALIDVAWALTQTQEFADLNRPSPVLVRGVYKIALDRDATEEEVSAAVAIMDEAPEPGARGAAVEGLLAGLLRRFDSILRKPPYGT
jgi:hypothetical protein